MGIFHRIPRRPKSKFSRKEKYVPTELSPLSEKLKSLGIGLKLVEISCPNWMWLVFLVFDSFMNNLSGRRQYFFFVNSFLNSSYSNWPRYIFSTQYDDSLMEKYGLSLQKRGFFDRLPRRPKSKFSKKEKYIPTELSPLFEKSKSLCIGLKLVKISCPNWMWLVFSCVWQFFE